MADFRIEYTIFMGDEEVGFGSSGTWGDLDSCAHAVSTDVQRGEWETSGESCPSTVQETCVTPWKEPSDEDRDS